MIFINQASKNVILSCRVTLEQKNIIEQKAYGSYRTISMYLRDCALDKKIIVVKGADELATELRRIGNNINQIAEYFPDYQVLVATHENTNCLHNHLIMNSVNFRNGKKFHQSRNEMLQFKEYSNQLCREYDLSVTEVKTKNKRNAEWKRQLIKAAQFAMLFSSTKEGFIEQMSEHGYGVRWEDNRKYITFTTPEGYKVRDNKLFDERLLKDNLEIYFAMGGCEAEESVYKSFCGYRTPEHSDDCSVTLSDGLKSFLGDILSSIPESYYYQPQYIDEINTAEKLRLEKILGRKISREAFVTYCTREQYEQEQGLAMQ